MPTLTITPTNVRGQGGAAPLATAGSVDTMWGDGSDATYAEDYGVTNGTGVGTLFGDIAPFTSGTINTAYATCRLQSGYARVAFGVTSHGDDSEIGYTIASMADTTPYYDFTPLAAADTIETLTLGIGDPDTGDAMTSAQLTSLFFSGFTLLARSAPFPPNSSTTITVYEFTVTIDYTPNTTPPLRNSPFRPGDVWGSAARNIPTPHTYQGGNRNVGGIL